MNREHQAILSLIALGKITPVEAERLLALCACRREEALATGIFVAAFGLEFLPVVLRATHTLVPQLAGLHQAITAWTHLIGGVL